ncbi:BAH domain containing protein [Musa troglodytarum]|uniref:BAH domain containing protein n=1 Tax=Musa troglodytarum TaxID=320322 RepID=A0A9E7FAX1_9LILI|nr:BAH domain containing protein [Musa troglodytarum]
MGKRRVAYVSDDEDEYPRRRNDADNDRYGDGDRKDKWKKELRVDEEGVEEGEIVCEAKKGADGGGGGRGGGEEEARVEEPEEDDEEEVAMEPQGDAKPIGDVVRVSGKGRSKKMHYSSFEFDGNVFELEDPVLLTPEDYKTKPYVAIIKDIAQDVDGNVWVTGQWFYRPEEAVKKGGGHWEARDHRELFYSFHLDEVPAESVMHKCVVHFVPLNKKWPLRQQFPGFIVQNVYDTVEKKLWKLTTKDYEGTKQHEIDLLVQKTRVCLGELSDVELEETSASPPVPLDHSDQLAIRRIFRRKGMDPIDVSRSYDATKTENQIRAETPGSCTSHDSECKTILAKCKALTGNSYRDKWLDKLLQGIKVAYFSKNSVLAVMNGNGGSGTTMGSNKNSSDARESISWPDSAVQAITALERVTYEALCSDFQKYNQKMRQLDFNLKNSSVLARRLLNKELDPTEILFMSPNELKDGLTAEIRAAARPEESKHLQMTDARCSRCTEKKVGVVDIIHAGGHRDRYLLECTACGYTRYASRDVISSLMIDG